MTLKEAVEHAATTLAQTSENTRLDAQLLLCHACDIEQTKIISHPEQTLNEKQLESFKAALSRRATGEPIAYITGSKEFWSLAFFVNEHVLIPRPETELLVELALQAIAEINAPRILDLGTGSGAIAISVAKERSDCFVTATDISQQALDVAKKNASNHNTKINFLQSNWYEHITENNFDLIISNPPYIAKDDSALDINVAQYEPNIALISHDNGLRDLQKIISSAKNYLSEKGCLMVEHGFRQAGEMQQLFQLHGYSLIQTHPDLAGLDRVTTGQNSKTV